MPDPHRHRLCNLTLSLLTVREAAATHAASAVKWWRRRIAGRGTCPVDRAAASASTSGSARGRVRRLACVAQHD